MVAPCSRWGTMLGRKEFTPKRFYEFSLEAQVPSDHLLRRIGAALDLSFVRRLTARFYSHTGRPGVDPVVLFKLMLLGYLYGITSERRLAEEARLHLAFRWFLGYDLDETRRTTRCCPRRGRASACPCTRRLFTEVVETRAGRPGAGRRPLRGQHAGQGQCQSWVGRRAGAAHSAAERGRVRRDGVAGESRLRSHAAAGPPGEGEQPAPDSAGGLTANARGAPVAARGRSGGRAQRGPGGR